MNRANHILLGWAETRNTNVIDPATNEDAYAQIIYMPGSSYPIQDKMLHCMQFRHKTVER